MEKLDLNAYGNLEELYNSAVERMLEKDFSTAVDMFRRLSLDSSAAYFSAAEVSLYTAAAYTGLKNTDIACSYFAKVSDEDGIIDIDAAYCIDASVLKDTAEFWKKFAESAEDTKTLYSCVKPLLVLNCFEEVIYILDQFVGASAEDVPDIELLRSIALLKVGRLQEALASVILYLDKNETIEACYFQGLIYFSLKEVKKAIACYKKALEIKPSCLKAKLRLGQAYMLNEKFASVKKVLNELVFEHPNCAEGYFGLSKCSLKLEKIEDALFYALKAHGCSPNVWSYVFEVGSLYDKLGINEKAYDFYCRAYEMVPGRFGVLSAFGRHLIKNEKFKEALPILEKASELKPNDTAVKRSLALVYSKIGNLRSAMALLSKLSAACPDDADLKREIGTVYLRSGNFEKAEEFLSAAAEKNEEDGSALYFLGVCRRALGKKKEHYSDLLRAAECSASEKQKIYCSAAEEFSRGQYESSSDKFDEASVLSVPENNAEYAYSALVQYFGVQANSLSERIKEEQQYSANVEESLFGFMSSLARLTDLRDAFSKSHSSRVASISDNLAFILGLDDEIKSGIHVGACLHDIGKAALEDRDMYSGKDSSRYEQHTMLGAEYFMSIPFPAGTIEAVKQHHECWDGSGFPEGLKGNDIHISAQIVGLADFYDRLVSRGMNESGPLSAEAAFEVIKGMAGSRFSPALVQKFAEKFKEIVS